MRPRKLICVSTIADMFNVPPRHIERAIRRAKIKPSAIADRTPIYRLRDIEVIGRFITQPNRIVSR